MIECWNMEANLKFKDEYKNLNQEQKLAVDSLDGPVMVVAGPGTGKTQVLALRIANILDKTDTPDNGVLCLTFTNAGVHAMRERLEKLMGSRGSRVVVSTFHSFAKSLIDKYYSLVGFDEMPALLDDTESIALVDEILENGVWEHLRPRSDSARYFSDLKSLVSLLKRENISPDNFLISVEAEIENLQNDPENISSRGARKGELKKEVENKIESLLRTKEVVVFYEEYEKLKFNRALMDYDDVLMYAVRLAQTSDEVKAFLRENYLYVLVDEHQDSSGVQNAFLEAVWGDTEKPNIFVVGDDRQLIYGFGGASIEQFQKFRGLFGKAKEITLVENYRSTQTILDVAESLIKSSFATEKLHANSKAFEEKVCIKECDYPRDEIIVAGIDIKKKIESGVAENECAILVPKNYQVREAVQILRDLGILVASSGTVSFFAQPETLTIKRILSALADPFNGEAIGELLLDGTIGIPVLSAHQFLRANMRKVNFETLSKYANSFLPTDPIARLGVQMEDWLKNSRELGIHGLVQKIGEDLFFNNPTDHEMLTRQVEIIRTYLHILGGLQAKNPHLTLPELVLHLDRLEHYGHEIPLAIFSGKSGVRVLTLHGSKGLEFQHVYIAHLDEGSLMKGKRNGFALPERVESLIQAKDEQVARRELYVAITRAKEVCTLLYPRHSYSGGELEPARILADFPENLIEKQSILESEGELIEKTPVVFVQRQKQKSKVTLSELADIVAGEYSKANVSVTLLNNFFECPWKWYFRNLLQLPEAKTESLLLGSAVHSGIEYIIKNREEGDFKNLDAVILNSLEKENISDEKIIKRMARETKKILEDFIKYHLPKISDSAKSERSISHRDSKYPHLNFYGKIDLTESSENGYVEVTDFKTGSGKTKSVIEKRDEEGRLSSFTRQLAMYTFLIQGAEKGTEVILTKLLFLEESPKSKDAVYATKITGEELELLQKDFADYDELLSSSKWVTRPCYAKTYGKGEECEHCRKAKMLYV
jgi:DNA helicase-2/ATP-dependent DNA helicase PcrA